MEHPGIATVELAGIRFACPSDWKRNIQESDEGWLAELQSQGVTFGVVAVIPVELDPIDMLEQTVDSLREEHPALELEEIFDEKTEAEHWEATFISLDMISYVWLFARNLGASTVLVLVQSIEPEAERGRLVFDAITRSLAPID